MKIKLFISLFVLTGFLKNSKAAHLQRNVDRVAFYSILKGQKVDDIDKEILVIEASSIDEKEAYKGALLMKKAGLVRKPKEKLRLFKQGRIKLETELRNNGSNTEYHFLRLIIQEHAPEAIKYHAQLEEDADYIKKNYKNLLPAVQQVVIDYSKTSKILHSSDF
ncbi:MAG TPA: hypothetical protein VKR32_17875 [Puia sp.]|nr:hypothetical protein [Puia sp.]